MIRKTLLPAVLLFLAAGCSGVLDVKPINEVEDADALTSPAKARAALAGLYDGLQSTSYYGGTFVFFSDLSADDVRHTGTFTTYHQADINTLTSDNTTIEALWDALYRVVGRANILIARVPAVPGLASDERDEMLGEAYLARALSFHNAVKLFGEQAPSGMGVPLPLAPPPDISAAGQVTRATTGATYTQILSDLAAAESLMTLSGGSSYGTHRGNVGAVHAIRARVYLYQQNWAAAETEAQVVAGMGYSLAPNYADLFGENSDTPEDIFVLQFTPVDFQLLGYYYRAKGAAGGRREIGPTTAFIRQYSPGYVAGNPATFTPTDLRGKHDISFQGTGLPYTVYGSKWPTGVGGEDFHIIRFAEVLLIEAEAEARQSKLVEAEASLTPIRIRAGLAAAGLDTMTQASAIAKILQERRFELAFEGHRWPDLVRTGLAASTLGIPAFQQLYPIPLNEIDVTSPPLTQNPGY